MFIEFMLLPIIYIGAMLWLQYAYFYDDICTPLNSNVSSWLLIEIVMFYLTIAVTFVLLLVDQFIGLPKGEAHESEDLVASHFMII